MHGSVGELPLATDANKHVNVLVSETLIPSKQRFLDAHPLAVEKLSAAISKTQSFQPRVGLQTGLGFGKIQW